MMLIGKIDKEAAIRVMLPAVGEGRQEQWKQEDWLLHWEGLLNGAWRSGGNWPVFLEECWV